MPGGEIRLVGRTQADSDDADPAVLHPLGEDRREARRRITHVVTDDDRPARGADLVRECGAERAHDIIGQLRPDESAHVVGLDEGTQVDRGWGHAENPRSLMTTCLTTCHPWGTDNRSECLGHRS